MDIPDIVIWGRKMHGEYLPITLPGCSKKIDKPVCAFAHVSNAER